MKKSPAIYTKILIGIGITAIIMAAVLMYRNKVQPTINTKTTTPANTSTTANKSAATVYADGAYMSEGSYLTPGGRETLDVALTIENDKIVSSTLIQKGKTPEAKAYQALFESEYRDAVVGKKVGDISLSRTAGASLTPAGFNEALKQIKSDARS